MTEEEDKTAALREGFSPTIFCLIDLARVLAAGGAPWGEWVLSTQVSTSRL